MMDSGLIEIYLQPLITSKENEQTYYNEEYLPGKDKHPYPFAYKYFFNFLQYSSGKEKY